MTEETPKETAEETAKEPTKKEQRAELQGAVKEAISAAGAGGATAETIALAIGQLDETTPKEDVKGILHEIRAVARQVVKKEGWCRMNRDGRNVLYQPISEADGQTIKDAADDAKKKAANEKKAAKKAAVKEEKSESGSEDGGDEDGGDVDDEDWEEGDDE